MLSYGKIVQVSGPVVDCEFQEGQLPKIREALRVQVEDEVRTMEVAQHMDEHTVRCIMLAPSEGLSRGMTVEATGRGISVPVGDATLGRMFNVLGDPIDGGEALPASTEKWNIHRQAPSFADNIRQSFLHHWFCRYFVGFSKQIQEEYKRCNTVKLRSTFFQIHDLLFYFFSSIGQPAFYSIFTDSESLRNIFYRHLFVVKHTDNHSLIFWQMVQNLHYKTLRFLLIHSHLRIQL